MPATARRLAIFQESVIREMPRLANQHQAITLAQGFPDFDPPEALLQAAEKAARQGPHQYAVTWGAANFRAASASPACRRTAGSSCPNPKRHCLVLPARRSAQISTTHSGPTRG